MRTINSLLAIACFVTSADLFASDEKLHYQAYSLLHNGKQYQVTIPAGYQLEVLVDNLQRPRLLTFNRHNELFIGSASGHIYRLLPPYRHATSLIELDDYPHNVAFRNGEILIAQTNGLYRAAYQPDMKKLEEENIELLAGLPGGWFSHKSRTVRIGPDSRVYVSLGISGNCSDQYLHRSYKFEDRRGGILALNEKGKKRSWDYYASGLRNPVGFDWHPVTRDMYATNNGPDHLGFEQPPEYFARVREGSFHGMPWFQFDGKKIKRDNCIESEPPRPITDVSIPAATFPARNAPMDVVFVPQGVLHESMKHDAIVALKGSWGTRPSGSSFGDKASRRHPGLKLVRFRDGKAVRVDDFISGFQLKDGTRWARPVGVAIGPDGALYFTSDSGLNALFRLSKKQAGRYEEK